MLGLTGREFVLPLLMRADAFAHARVPPPPRARPMNDLLPGLRAALAREEATSATRSTAEVELAATGSTPSSSAEPRARSVSWTTPPPSPTPSTRFETISTSSRLWTPGETRPEPPSRRPTRPRRSSWPRTLRGFPVRADVTLTARRPRARTASTTRRVAELDREMATEVMRASEKAASLRRRVDALAATARREPDSPATRKRPAPLSSLFRPSASSSSTDPTATPFTPTDRRLIETTTEGLQRRLATVVRSFDVVRASVRERRRRSLTSRVFLATGATPDPDAFERILDADSDHATTRLAVLRQTGEGGQTSGSILALAECPRAFESGERSATRVPPPHARPPNGLSRTSLPTAEDAEEEARATRDAAMDVERGMLQLHQIFLDVASAVERQGEVIDLVETRVGAARPPPAASSAGRCRWRERTGDGGDGEGRSWEEA